MNTLTLFMGICCIGSVTLLAVTLIQEKVSKKRKKNSSYNIYA